MPYIIGLDVGGTFTDCVVVDPDGQAWMDKAFTTPEDLTGGVIAALQNVCAQTGISTEMALTGARVFALGTTSLINRVVSRRGANVGLITTKGHEDVIKIGRVLSRSEGLPEQLHYDVAAWNKPEPLYVGGGVRGVPERIDAGGVVVAALDEDEVARAAEELRDLGVDSIAVVFLWSFLNPVHEQRARDVIRRVAPGMSVNLSSEVAPTLGEFERANTTLMNAYLAPGAERDFMTIDAKLREHGLGQALLLMQSNGGLAASEELRRKPVTGLAAGPVGGVVGSQKLAAAVGAANAICTDMGGTSFDVGLIVNGSPIFSSESVVERHRLRVPTVEVTSIGAGGGSIAYVDDFGDLHVGPQSAGSSPGPACYGRGGTEPTVTDANVVLGRIAPGSFWNGRQTLNREAAERAITLNVAEPLGLSCVEAALGIVDIVDARMADLLRTMTVSTGYDPRDFVLFAYGGAGPVHVGSYAAQLGVSKIYVPIFAPVQSAFGIATGELRRHHTKAIPMREPYDMTAVRIAIEEIKDAVRSEWLQAGFAPAEATYQYFVDMRFRYQVHEIRVPVDLDDLGEGLVGRFVSSYEQAFGVGSALDGSTTEILTMHVVSTIPAADYQLAARPEGTSIKPDHVGIREVFYSSGAAATPVYRATDLRPGIALTGPLVVESANTSVIVHPEQTVEMDEFSNLLISVREVS